MNADGDFGVACHNMRLDPFPYVVQNGATNGTKSMTKQCSKVGDQIDDLDRSSSNTIIILVTLLSILLV